MEILEGGDSKKIQEAYRLCFNIPKVELHAHIGGCLRASTFLELAEANGISIDNIDFHNINLKSAFEIFSIVGKVVNNLDVLQRVTREIIEDYYKSNTCYLELRTGPKEFGDNSMDDYIEALISVFEECKEDFPSMNVRLLISINRGLPMETNVKVYELAKKYIIDNKCEYISGIEFSGNPNSNSFLDYLENIFQPARDLGIKISIHAAEIKDHNDETEAILKFRPDRLGHCCYMDDDQFKLIKELEIPVEVCPSSNKATMDLALYSQVKSILTLYNLGVCIVPCCDDTMLFNTNMINELFEIVNMLKLDQQQIKSMILNSVNAIFDDAIKENIISKIKKIKITGEESKEDNFEAED